MALNPKLPLSSIQTLTDESRVYLEENFKFCLGVNFLGGDIREDYPDYGRGFIAKIAESGGFVCPDDEKWKTKIGREVLDFYKDDLPDDFLPLVQ